MKSIKVWSTVGLLSAVVVCGSVDLRAETITQKNGVTTVRGVDDASTAEQRRLSRGRSGVAVFRGTSNAVEPTPDVPQTLSPQQVVGGRNLWIYDPARGEVTACSLRYDFYGRRGVRCRSDQY